MALKNQLRGGNTWYQRAGMSCLVNGITGELLVWLIFSLNKKEVGQRKMTMTTTTIIIIEMELNTQTDFSQWVLNTLHAAEGFMTVTGILQLNSSLRFFLA